MMASAPALESCRLEVNRNLASDPAANLRELGLAVAHQVDERTMACGAGGNQRAVHDMRTIVAKPLADKIGQFAAGPARHGTLIDLVRDRQAEFA